MTAPTFAKSHNLVSFLAKLVVSEGFEQIIDFLNGSSVKYALTASPTIRTSCIKQFWSTAKVKTVNDEVRVHALINAKRINIKESSIHGTLKLDDEEDTSCLANDEIFTALWYRQSSVLPQTRSLTSQGDMSHHQDIYDNPSLTKKVFANMKRVGTGFSWVITPLFKNMLVPAAEEVGQAQDDDSLKLQELIDLYTRLANKVLDLESEVIDIKSSFTHKIEKLEDKVHKLKDENRILTEKSFKSAKIDIAAPVEDKEESFKQGRMIADIDEDVEEEPAEVEEVLEVVTTAKLITEVVTTAEPTTTATQVPKASTPRRRMGIVIQDPEETVASVIVNIKIHHEKNKSYYKIIRVDGSHKLFLSFVTLLKNFDREDLETLWKLVKERFETTEPKNFSDDFLLNILKIMFEKPNIEANQILNNIRLKVEEKSEMSLELLRLVRRQLNEGYVPE
nr:hypothetical protein [Tanacetum cinerariifolium]